jgi:hypothetical protein
VGRDRNRDQRRRGRILHAPRRVHDNDSAIIDVGECQAMLARGEPKDEVERLAVLVSIQLGSGMVTFRELKHAVHAVVLEAGSVKAAIKALRRG